MKSVARNYIAKIAILALLKYIELSNSNFSIAESLAQSGEADLDDLDLFDKYYFKDLDNFVSAVQDVDSDNKSFFISIGLGGIASKIGSYSFFLQNSENFRDVLNKSSQFSHIITNIISSIEVTEVNDMVKVNYNFSRETLALKGFSRAAIIELCYSSLVTLFNELSLTKKYKLSFHSSCKHQLADEEISQLLGHDFISKSDDNYVIVPKAAAEEKNQLFEANLPSAVSHGLSKHIEARNTGSLVAIISNLLEIAPASSLEDISKQLLISKRTLQRRLKEQDVNFSVLKQTVANQRSLELLDTKEHSVEEIAKLIGYSSTATFVHAFTKWHGVSPSAYQKKN